MSSRTQRATSGPSDDRSDEPMEVEWTQTRAEDEHRQWWKAGSNHVNATHTTLHVRELATDWVVRVEEVNQYGLVESDRTIQCVDADRDAEERCLRHAREFMRERPPRRPFTGAPELPREVGDWELVEEEPREWTWEAGDHRLAVEHAGFSATGDARHDLVWRHPDHDSRSVLEEAVTVRALRSAERCMATNPDGRLGDSEILDRLQSIPGVGPSKALDLQLLGLPTLTAVEAALHAPEGDLDIELAEALDRLLTAPIRDYFDA